MKTQYQYDALVNETVNAIRETGLPILATLPSRSECGQSTYIRVADQDGLPMTEVRVSDHSTGASRHMQCVHVQDFTGVTGIDSMLTTLQSMLAAREADKAARIERHVQLRWWSPGESRIIDPPDHRAGLGKSGTSALL